MRQRPAVIEVAWGKSSSDGWCVLVGYLGSWEIVSSGHKTKIECMKAVAKTAKRLAGHPALMQAVRAILADTHGLKLKGD